jgi:hypothetical protein
MLIKQHSENNEEDPKGDRDDSFDGISHGNVDGRQNQSEYIDIG